jgi:hypothetical protein
MGHQHQQAPAITQATATSAAQIELEEPVAQPVALDSVRTASLMLRQVQVSGERSYKSGGIGQAIAFIRRLEDVLDEVRALEKLQPSSVSALGEELARVRETTTRIASRLHNDEKLSTFAADVIAKLDNMNPASAVPASAVAPKDLSTPERTELVRLELAAARTQVGVVLAAPPKNVDEAARIVAPLKGHLAEARNAAMAIDRSMRGPLFADVDQVSQELDGVERALTMDPKFAWHAAFAGAFDAENRLRSAVGLHARARAYSGTVDPKAAAQQVLEELNDTGAAKKSRPDPATATPQQSVVDVGLNIASAYERMHDDMMQFQSDLSVTDPPALSIGDMLVNATLTILMDVVTAGIASFMGDALTKVLASPGAAAAAAKVANELGGGRSAATIAKKVAEHEALRQASINAAARSRVAGIMKMGTSKLQIAPATPSSPTLLSHFVATTIAGITAAKLDSTRLVVGLGDALSQLDPAALRELDLEMLAKIDDPARALVARALIEYERLRTENAVAARAGHVDPLLNAKHVVNWRDEDIAGVLEVGLNVSSADDVTFDYLRLQGSEPSARARLHANKQPLRGLGLHRIFHIRFASAKLDPTVASVLQLRDFLTFGVGATEGLELETIDEKEWLWLRLLAAGNQVNDLNALALELRDQELGDANTPEKAATHLRHQIEQRVSRDAAIAKVRSMISFGDTLTTEKVAP